MRRYEPKPWDIRRCDMVPADDGEYVCYDDARAEIERLNSALADAACQISDLAARLGRAEGKFDASELVGVVEGWRERALKAEAERDEARAQVAAAYDAATSICADQFAAHMTAAIYGDPNNSRAREAAAAMAERLLHSIRALTPADAQAALDKMLAEARLEGWRAGRDAAAEHCWAKRDLLADAEQKQVAAGLTGRDYYGRRLEAELLSRSIRALPEGG